MANRFCLPLYILILVVGLSYDTFWILGRRIAENLWKPFTKPFRNLWKLVGHRDLSQHFLRFWQVFPRFFPPFTQAFPQSLPRGSHVFSRCWHFFLSFSHFIAMFFTDFSQVSPGFSQVFPCFFQVSGFSHIFSKLFPGLCNFFPWPGLAVRDRHLGLRRSCWTQPPGQGGGTGCVPWQSVDLCGTVGFWQ